MPARAARATTLRWRWIAQSKAVVALENSARKPLPVVLMRRPAVLVDLAMCDFIAQLAQSCKGQVG